jgi:hypothetical protein
MRVFHEIHNPRMRKRSHTEESRMTRDEPKGDDEADAKLLEDVVLGVERALKLNNIAMGAEEKAETAGRLFELMLRDENGTRDQLAAIVETAIRHERARKGD